MANEHVVDNATVILEAGKALARSEFNASSVDASGAQPVVLTPAGQVKSIEKFLPSPLRVRATVIARTAGALIDYVRSHLENSVIFAWAGDDSFLAVIDYHEPPRSTLTPAKASWCSHRVSLTLQPTTDWMRWIGANKKQMNQEDFAQFIEDNMQNIAKPHGAELFELVRQLEATKSVNFASSVRLDNGERQLLYEETVVGKAGQKGTMKVPTEFTLGIAPFEGSPPYEVVARFRYRIDGGLRLWFDLMTPEKVIEAAFNAELVTIVEGLPGVPVYGAKFVADVSVDLV